MRSAARDVDEYVASHEEPWLGVLVRLRAACRARLAGYDERLEFGMPGYARDGRLEVGFAKQARYLSIYVLKQGVLDARRDELVGLSVGKGCVRFSRPEQVRWEVIDALLDATVASDEAPC